MSVVKEVSEVSECRVSLGLRDGHFLKTSWNGARVGAVLGGCASAVSTPVKENKKKECLLLLLFCGVLFRPIIIIIIIINSFFN